MSGDRASGGASAFVRAAIRDKVNGINREVTVRAYRVSNELRNSSLYILRGQSSGQRRYKVPGTKQYYTPSTPGSPPAVRTGAFRNSWMPRTYTESGSGGIVAVSVIESRLMVGKYVLGDLLEGGTRKMAPRPYKQPIIDHALPKIIKIYSAPYNV